MTASASRTTHPPMARGGRNSRGPKAEKQVRAANGTIVGKAPRTSSAANTKGKSGLITYRPRQGVDDFVRQVREATPLQLVDIERRGVAGRFVKDLAKRMEIPAVRIFDMLGVPKATVEKKAASGELVSGTGGQAALGMARLIGIAQDIAANSTAPQAQGFDAAQWLGRWLERSQPSLGGRKPAELIDTPTGVEVVARLLGAIESGSCQ